MQSLVVLLGLVGAFLAAVELWFRSRERSPLVMLPKERTPWALVTEPGFLGVRTIIPIRNFSTRYEATVRDVRPSVRVLWKGEPAKDLHVRAVVKAEDPHGHADVREDGYWSAHIVVPGSYVGVEMTVEVTGALDKVEQIHAVVIELAYETYLRQGFQTETCEIVLPGQFEVRAQLAPVKEADAIIYPIRTHILTDADDMASVVDKYVKPIAQPGDVVVAAESVVAIMQRRYRRPQDVALGFWAKRLCYLIPNVGSLSTPWGFQCAIDDVGLPRMLTAVVVGAAFKLVGKNGWMYTIAGLPSELIDDVTGTMPPYDKYIVMGPDEPQKVVDAVKAKTGVEAAIADVNNLRRARIVAATAGVVESTLTKQLLGNPSGNASEQTPLVLVRPASAESERSEVRDTSRSV